MAASVYCEERVLGCLDGRAVLGCHGALLLGLRCQYVVHVVVAEAKAKCVIWQILGRENACLPRYGSQRARTISSCVQMSLALMFAARMLLRRVMGSCQSTSLVSVQKGALSRSCKLCVPRGEWHNTCRGVDGSRGLDIILHMPCLG